MASPSEKLALSLERLQDLQGNQGSGAIRSKDLTRTDRERLIQNGFLQEVMKGWYVPSRPDEKSGESTAWYASFWLFCAAYLEERFGKEWSLSPEQSLSVYAGNWTVPKQLLVRANKAGNKVIGLPHGTSLLDVRAALPNTNETNQVEGLRVFSLEAALIQATPTSFKQSPTDVRTALSLVKDTSSLLTRLLDGGHSLIGSRLAGGFRNIGRAKIADEIIGAMQAAGYKCKERDPFIDEVPQLLNVRETSPYVNRLRLLWQSMRNPVIEHFPSAPGLPKNLKGYLKDVDKAYVSDAYHSLSIEGYQVTRELIERVRSGKWNPDQNKADLAQRNAMAARGYWQAFQAVHKSVEAALQGGDAGDIADNDHNVWYRELFAPSVVAGLLNATDLAGYRQGPVLIRGSMHVPLKREALPDVMPAFFELLKEETDPRVRVILGHFCFVYIHPYIDGNGRIGRFLMNLMLASGGYPWTIVPVEVRTTYMDALEKASVGQNIVPLTKLLGGLVSQNEGFE